MFNLLIILEFRDANMESCLQHYWKTFSSYIGKIHLKGSQRFFPSNVGSLTCFERNGNYTKLEILVFIYIFKKSAQNITLDEREKIVIIQLP